MDGKLKILWYDQIAILRRGASHASPARKSAMQIPVQITFGNPMEMACGICKCACLVGDACDAPLHKKWNQCPAQRGSIIKNAIFVEAHHMRLPHANRQCKFPCKSRLEIQWKWRVGFANVLVWLETHVMRLYMGKGRRM